MDTICIWQSLITAWNCSASVVTLTTTYAPALHLHKPWASFCDALLFLHHLVTISNYVCCYSVGHPPGNKVWCSSVYLLPEDTKDVMTMTVFQSPWIALPQACAVWQLKAVLSPYHMPDCCVLTCSLCHTLNTMDNAPVHLCPIFYSQAWYCFQYLPPPRSSCVLL